MSSRETITKLYEQIDRVSISEKWDCNINRSGDAYMERMQITISVYKAEKEKIFKGIEVSYDIMSISEKDAAYEKMINFLEQFK